MCARNKGVETLERKDSQELENRTMIYNLRYVIAFQLYQTPVSINLITSDAWADFCLHGNLTMSFRRMSLFIFDSTFASSPLKCRPLNLLAIKASRVKMNVQLLYFASP